MEKHALSVRAYNACSDNKLTNLGLLLDFWYEKGDFISFRNIGRKTEEELSSLCQFYFSKLPEYFVTNGSARLEDIPATNSTLDSLSEYHVSAINVFIQDRLKQLSTRAINALNNDLLQSVDFKNIRGRFFKNKSVIRRIKNIGRQKSCRASSRVVTKPATKPSKPPKMIAMQAPPICKRVV